MLAAYPNQADVLQKLAELEASLGHASESRMRFEQAIALEPENDERKLAYAQAMHLWGDFYRIERIYRELLRKQPEDGGLWLKLAEVLTSSQRYEEAEGIYERLRLEGIDREPSSRETGHASETEEPPLSGPLPRKLIPKRYADLGKRVFEADFLDQLLQDPAAEALDLCTWADQYTQGGRPDIAWRLYARAVEIDPACFPARLGLAETLAFDRRYAESLKVLEALCEEYPDHGKLWITYARVLSWDKQYDRAIDAYDRIHAVNPADPIPMRESARVAAWAKRMNEAMNRYQALMAPAVDELLRQALLEQPAASVQAKALSNALFGRDNPERPRDGYAAYEDFVERMQQEPGLSADIPLQRIRIALLPRYRIQKWADLESTAKLLAWDKRFLAARDAYARLIAFDPGNAEALFDDAQVKCALGLCNEEAAPYEALLRMDPTHVQAARGLERIEIRSRPRIGIDGRSWTEKGRGDLSHIVVHQMRILAEVPLRQDRYAISAGMDSWYEQPQDERRMEALGYTLQARGVLLPSLSGNIRWTHKAYQETELGASELFDASLRWKARDRLWVDLGYERADEIANRFALRQQSQADHWKIGVQSQITRKLDAGLKAEWIDYSDDNTGKLFSGAIGYAFTDHPRIFKAIWTETWRDTANDNRYLYAGERLVDIVHPYWTPRSLTESAITLEWNHDLARELFCGAPENVYDVRLSFGTDTEDNAMIRLEADWKVEIADRWLLVLRGLIHESRQWDAAGVWAEIRYRF